MIQRKKAFTLIELLLVVIISGSILTTIYGIMTILPKVKNFNDARQNLIQQTDDIMNRFAILLQDYSIDYEEYFNRMKVGCNGNSNDNFWDIGDDGYCRKFTAYGNHNSKLIGEGKETEHYLLYCSSDSKDPSSNQLLKQQNCQLGTLESYTKLSYGQYKQLFWDVKNDTDNLQIGGKPYEVGDSDDRDLGKGPAAIPQPQSIKELYLISHDESRRLFLRRKLKKYEDHKGNAYTGYTIQILKLRGFDAGSEHGFNAEHDKEVYDGQIDTRVCDYGQQFVCHGGGIPNYDGYQLPEDEDDGWVDLFDDNLNIVDWNIQISPVKNPDYAWAEADQQINPFIKIALTAELSEHLRSKKLAGNTKGFRYTLQNTYDTKGFYLK